MAAGLSQSSFCLSNACRLFSFLFVTLTNSALINYPLVLASRQDNRFHTTSEPLSIVCIVAPYFGKAAFLLAVVVVHAA